MAGLREAFAAEEPVKTALDRTAAGAVLAIPGAAAATITALTRERPSTQAWTDARYLALDHQQYAADRGPCLVAAREGRQVRANTAEHRGRWPEFSAAAEHADVRSYLSSPLVVEPAHPTDDAVDPGQEPELVGSLNLYGHRPDAFDAFDEALVRLFAVVAAQAITGARLGQRLRTRLGHLELALSSRAEIDQAKGILMAVHRCSAEEAFGRLAAQSQRRNVKVRQIAREFLATVTQPPRS